MIKNKPVIGIIPTYQEDIEEHNPYNTFASFVTMYSKKIRESGGIPLGLLEENIEEYMDICDGYLYPGGKKVIHSFSTIIEDCVKNHKPLLGVCLGMQATVMYFNILEDRGEKREKSLLEVYNENKEKNPYLKKLEEGHKHFNAISKWEEVIKETNHKVTIEKDSLLHSIYDTTELDVPSMHNYVVARVPKDVKVIAKSIDGIIEGVEYTKNDSFILGVQWHPEILEDSRIFDWLIRRCNIKYQMLVNKQIGINDAYDFKIENYNSLCPECGSGGNIEHDALTSWILFRDYVRENGYFIDVESAHRKTEFQKKLYEDSVKNNGEEYANAFVAPPGHSEHETGLAIDIAMRTESGKWVIEFDSEFLECHQFLKENCSKFGFILRYPKGKEEMTGYHYEPWHFRYIGNQIVAEYIMKNNLCLEEYYEKEKIKVKEK